MVTMFPKATGSPTGSANPSSQSAQEGQGAQVPQVSQPPPGYLFFNRPPRKYTLIEPLSIEIDTPPTPPSSSLNTLMSTLGLPAVTVLIMLLAVMLQSGSGGMTQLSFLLISVGTSLAYLIFAVWSYFYERRTSERTYREQAAEFDKHFAERKAQLIEAITREQRVLNERDPEISALLRFAGEPSAYNSDLWERRPNDDDFLHLRFGLGKRRGSAQISFKPTAKKTERALEVGKLIEQYSNIDPAPLTLPLTQAGSVGVCGSQEAARGLVLSLLCQALAHHSPTEVRVAAIYPQANAAWWDWLKWAPHTAMLRGGGPEERMLAATPERAEQVLRLLRDEISLRQRRLAEQSAGDDLAASYLVVLLDGNALLGDMVITDFLLARGKELRILTIYLADEYGELPSDCGAVLRVDGRNEGVLRNITPPGPDIRARIDQAYVEQAHSIARNLGPFVVRATSAESGIPDQTGLLEIMGVDNPAAAPIWETWTRNLPHFALRAPIGKGAGDSIMHLSLDANSPEGGVHGMIGGTTGSGKSELLRTLILSFAANHHPHQLNFVLIDYKGGSAFSSLSKLPHVAGFLTNLDGHLADRALIALRSEVNARMRILSEAGRIAGRNVESLEAYHQLKATNPKAANAVLPRLLIVVDEFSQLKQEVPEFMLGLIEIARLGRSLGVHLLLATQKPGSAITDEIRANMDFKISLRVAGTQDSNEIIGSAEAALLPRGLPGRGLVRVGNEALVQFQTARSTLPHEARAQSSGQAVSAFAPSVSSSAAGSAGRLGAAATIQFTTEAATELKVLVDKIIDIAAQNGVDKPPRLPWVRELPAALALPKLKTFEYLEDGTVGSRMGRVQGEKLPIVIGLLDEPTGQHEKQYDFAIDLRQDGHVFAFGTAQSGKSTLLRTAAVSIALQYEPSDVRIYGIDCGRGALAKLADLPHCGNVLFPANPDDVERTVRLFEDLSRTMAERKAEFNRTRTQDLGEYIKLAGANSYPNVVVLIDNFSQFVETFFGNSSTSAQPVLPDDMSGLMRGELIKSSTRRRAGRYTLSHDRRDMGYHL